MASHCRSWATSLVLFALSNLPATAGDWVEARCQPQVGSRWIIQRDIFKEERRHENGVDRVNNSTLRITGELTIEGKTADGYRLSYRRIKSSYESEGTEAAAMRAALAVLDNVLVHATADARGKPLRVENLEDIRTAIAQMVARVAGEAQDPQTAATVRELLTRMANIDGIRGADELLDELPDLALTQNTGAQAWRAAAHRAGAADGHRSALRQISDPVDRYRRSRHGRRALSAHRAFRAGFDPKIS